LTEELLSAERVFKYVYDARKRRYDCVAGISLNDAGKYVFALAPSSVMLLEICDVVRRLLMANAMEVYE
jgi:hypothetical protein